MRGIAIVLALHVAAVVLWIGGVGFVTMALLPALREMRDPRERLALFEALEHRFSRIARANILVAGATGFYLVARLHAWTWFAAAAFWWAQPAKQQQQRFGRGGGDDLAHARLVEALEAFVALEVFEV